VGDMRKSFVCLPVSFAMMLHTSPDVILNMLQYRGGPRDFHPQEMIDLCIQLGHRVTEIEMFPCFVGQKGLWDETHCIKRMDYYLRQYKGVLAGKVNGHQHSVYWNGKEIEDPNGTKYPLNRFEIRTFFFI